MEKTRFTILFLCLTTLFACRTAGAFPIFARKYETGCVTCHVAIPKLNSFGVVFRNNGFEWPGGDEDMVKDRPIVLSAEANREGFPDTVWPSWLPRAVPVSVLVASELALAPSNSHWLDASGLGTDVELGVGGPIARGFAVRADLVLSGDPLQGTASLSIEQAWAQINLWTDHLSFRFGRFWPELFDFVQQSLVGDYWLYVRSMGDTPFALEGRPGGELRGIAAWGRFRYVLGTSASAGTIGSQWDVWARAGIKIGGLRYDGVDNGAEVKADGAKASQPFRDDSLQLGVFGYYGHSQYCVDTRNTPSLVTRDPNTSMVLPCTAGNNAIMDEFIHTGVSLNAWLGSANLVGAFLAANHSHLWADPATGPSAWFFQIMAQLDYVIFPWLVPSVRFEYSGDVEGRNYDPAALLWHGQAGSSFLIRANFRAYTYVEIGPGPGATASVAFTGMRIGALAAF